MRRTCASWIRALLRCAITFLCEVAGQAGTEPGGRARRCAERDRCNIVRQVDVACRCGQGCGRAAESGSRGTKAKAQDRSRGTRHKCDEMEVRYKREVSKRGCQGRDIYMGIHVIRGGTGEVRVSESLHSPLPRLFRRSRPSLP